MLGERKRPRKKKKKEKEKVEVDDYYDPDISLAEAIAEDAECCVPEVNPSPEQSCMNPDIPVPSEEPGSSYDIYEGPDGRLFKSSGRDKFVSHQDLPELDVIVVLVKLLLRGKLVVRDINQILILAMKKF